MPTCMRWSSQVISDLGLEKRPPQPFLIITSTKNDPSGRPWRLYPWGKAYPTDRDHSDFIVLKRLMLGDMSDSLWELVRASYTKFLQSRASCIRAGCNLQPLIDESCAVCRPHLEYEALIGRGDLEKLQGQIAGLRRNAGLMVVVWLICEVFFPRWNLTIGVLMLATIARHWPLT